jgi:type IV pilus assembly protein PilQ
MQSLQKKLPIVLVCGHALFFSLCLLWGCAQTQEKKEDPFLDKWKEMAESSRGHSPSQEMQTMEVPEREKVISAEQLTEVVEERELPTETLTLRMYDVDLPVLLRALARAAGQNILINQNVKGKASINIVEAPWDQVFTGILHTHGLTYRWEGEILRIVSLKDIQLNLQLAEADQKAMAQSREMELVEPLVTRIVRINYPKLENIKETLEDFLKRDREKGHPGSITMDTHTNSLIVSATRDDMDRILAIIEQLDKPTPQILIEAVIVEATRRTARELGIQWGGLTRGIASGKNLYVSGAGNGVFNDFQFSDGAVDPTGSWALNLPADILSGSNPFSMGLIYETVGENLLAMQLSALQDEGKINILSTPSITTINNEEASIESGREVPYETASSNGTNVQFKKALLSLKVIPTVINERTLRLDITTTNNEVETNAGTNPPITTREAKTVVFLYDGETTVIGGLSQQTTNKTNTGVPGLKDVPGLGYLFKTTGDSVEMEDLLIFITPHILKEKQ